MYFALMSTDGNVLAWFEDVDSAYEAADETDDVEVVQFSESGFPMAPPARTYRATYGQVEPRLLIGPANPQRVEVPVLG